MTPLFRSCLLTLSLGAVMAVLFAGCAPSLEQRKVNAASAMAFMEDSRFDEANDEAISVLEQDSQNPYAATIAAITDYKITVHDLVTDVMTVFVGALATGNFNQRYLRTTLDRAAKDLSSIDEHLEIASTEPALTMDMCLACWEVDWNHNGAIDDFDRHLLEIELDEDEREYRKDDPRRRPTYRFDHGDLLWARAFISFQRAALDIARAYDWEEIGHMFGGGIFSRGEEPPDRITFRLTHPELMEQGRKRILEGLNYSDRAREAYLAETDDEREWLPNPNQRDHPLPLPVDDALYDTWEKVVDDLRRIVRAEEGLSVAELAQLGDHEWRRPPRGYLDIGRMLTEPRDVVLELENLEELADSSDSENRRAVERRLSDIFGVYYVRKMKPSPLLKRANRMKSEVVLGVESIERKLRYLVWIN